MTVHGQMDRLVNVEMPSTAQASGGEDVITWVNFATSIWAEKLKASPTERFQDHQRVAGALVIWRMYYLPGITEVMRIVDTETGVFHNITGIEEIGRKGYHIIYTQAERDTIV